MTKTSGYPLAERPASPLVGRVDEMAALLSLLGEGGAVVTHVHGPAGVGKTALLAEFAVEASRRGASVFQVDCRLVEPSERGLLREMSGELGQDLTEVSDLFEALSQLRPPAVLIFDSYESWAHFGTRFRQALAGGTSSNVRVVVASRIPPLPAWIAAPEWSGTLQMLRLGPLTDEEALELLGRSGLDRRRARQIARTVRGHPLALKMACAMSTGSDSLDDGAAAILDALARIFTQEIDDPVTERVLEAASVVRRTTKPLLGAMLPGVSPDEAYERLSGLPFVEVARDGLRVHDAVHESVAASLKAAHPARFRRYQRAAWGQIWSELRKPSEDDLWRYTPDMLWLIDNPYLREAFFPTGANLFAVEPAGPADGEAIRSIARKHDVDAARPLEAWWRQRPEFFSVVRNDVRETVGFYCLVDLHCADPKISNEDPVAALCLADLEKNPIDTGQIALLIRRWLAEESGEGFSPQEAACFLDLKRRYLTLRPAMRRLYATFRDIDSWRPMLASSRFEMIESAPTRVADRDYYTMGVDFGPMSVDGWLAGLVAGQLGAEPGGILDVGAREVHVDGSRIPLTRLEFEVMNYLCLREGQAVGRADLIANVWGYEYEGGSNIVDSIVRSLRQKLGSSAAAIETVRGLGYRYRSAATSASGVSPQHCSTF